MPLIVGVHKHLICIHDVVKLMNFGINDIPYFLDYTLGLEYISLPWLFPWPVPHLKFIVPRGYIQVNMVLYKLLKISNVCFPDFVLCTIFKIKNVSKVFTCSTPEETLCLWNCIARRSSHRSRELSEGYELSAYVMPPLHQDTSELGVVPCGKEIWTWPHGTTREEKRHTGTPRVS